MPGYARGAVSVGVMPFSLSTKFQEIHAVQGRRNEYHDGTLQLFTQVSQARRTWKLTKRLTPAQMITLRAWVDAHPADAFYFYNPVQSSFTWDATGVSTIGRYLVRLNSDWAQTMDMARGDASIELLEVGADADTGEGVGGIINDGHGPVTAATLSITASWDNPGNVVPDVAGVGASITGGFSDQLWGPGDSVNSFTGVTRTWPIPSGAIPAINTLAITCDGAGTLLSTSPTCTLGISDISLTVTFLDGQSATVRSQRGVFTPGDYTVLVAIGPYTCTLQQQRFGGLITRGFVTFSNFLVNV
jgi:hypothetical protein